jgi:hypothetical protein
MPLGGNLAYLGKSKMDKTKRISLIKEAADLFDIEEGDHIYFHAINGKIVITKATKKFNSFDIEGEIIEERIRRKEAELTDAEIDRYLNKDPSDEYDKLRKEAEELYKMYAENKNKRLK